MKSVGTTLCSKASIVLRVNPSLETNWMWGEILVICLVLRMMSPCCVDSLQNSHTLEVMGARLLFFDTGIWAGYLECVKKEMVVHTLIVTTLRSQWVVQVIVGWGRRRCEGRGGQWRG